MCKIYLFVAFASCLVVCSVAAERKSVEKCLEYSKAEFIYDDLTAKKCYLQEIKNVQDGTVAKPKELPHMANIGYFKEEDKDARWFCLGILISENYVLTAAQCLSNTKISGLPSKVRFGDFKIAVNGVESQEVEIEETKVHPEYDSQTNRNDIALIKLKESVKMNVFVRPACLYSKSDISETKGLFGGRQGKNLKSGPELTLLHVLAEIQTNKKCVELLPADKLNRRFNDDGTQLCASSLRDQNDNCRGESGSALVLESQTPCMYDAVGFVIAGKTCGKVENPEIYTNIPYYLDWIEKIVWA